MGFNSGFKGLIQFGFATPFSLKFCNLNSYATATVTMIHRYKLTFILKLDTAKSSDSKITAA